MIISYLGFKTINYSLNMVDGDVENLAFSFIEEENLLDEVMLSKQTYDDEWKNNLIRFKNGFIGETDFAKNCEINNPKVLHFETDFENQILKATASRPLKITNKSLGYEITYDLEYFVINKKLISYLGYAHFQKLEGSTFKQKRWKKNRLIAYHGSVNHFFESVINNSIIKEGFVVYQFKRIANPERPSEESLKAARKLVGESNRNYFILDEKQKKIIDSALVIVRKGNLPKYKDSIFEESPYVLTQKSNLYYLEFKNNIHVTYEKEKVEKQYFLINEKTQNSSLLPLKKPVIFDEKGILINPLEVIFEGYWSYEKFGNSLPLDFNPFND